MAHRGDVVGRVHQRQQREDAVVGALVLLGEPAGQQAVLVEPAGFEQVVMQGEPVEGPAGLAEDQLFNRGRRHDQVGLVAPQLLDGRQRLVAQETVRILQRPEQGLQRRLAGNARQRRRDVPAHPLILLAVLHEVDQRRHDLLAVAGQHVARRALQQPVAQQRDQRRHEQEVAGAEPGGAADGVAGHVDVGVEHQRHEQRPERRVGHAAERAGDFGAGVGALLARVVDQLAERLRRAIAVGLLGAVRQRRGGGDHQRRIRVVEVGPHQRGRLLALHAGQGAHGGAADLALVIGQAALDAPHPAVGADAPGRLGQAQHPHPHVGVLVVEHQRADQVALVERLEQVERVDHPLRPRDGPAPRPAPRWWRGRPVSSRISPAVMSCCTMLRRNASMYSARARRREEHPQRHDGQAGVAQLLPGERQAPVLDEHQDHQRAGALRQAIDGDVDERLGAVLDVGGQRQEQDLARGLVDRVAQRGVDDAGHPGGPQRADDQHQQAGGAEADRQDHQREADAQQAVDTAGEGHLDEEADERQVDGDLGEERGDAVGVRLALRLGGGHVELLLDDCGADGRKGDHHGDDLQVARPAEQGQRFAAADPFLLAGLGRVAGPGALVAADDAHDDQEADAEDRGADQQHRRRAELGHQRGGDRRAGGTAQAGAAADQPEQALGLPGIVDVVGQGPELADQQDAEDQPVEVEADRYPLGADLGEQHPEGDQQHDHAGLRRPEWSSAAAPVAIALV